MPGRSLGKNSPMNREMEKWFGDQAHWQKARRTLSWPEKIHMAEQIRESIGRWSQSAVKKTGADIPQTRTKKKGPNNGS